MSKISGVAMITISRLETGSDATISTLLKLLKALNVVEFEKILTSENLDAYTKKRTTRAKNAEHIKNCSASDIIQ